MPRSTSCIDQAHTAKLPEQAGDYRHLLAQAVSSLNYSSTVGIISDGKLPLLVVIIYTDLARPFAHRFWTTAQTGQTTKT